MESEKSGNDFVTKNELALLQQLHQLELDVIKTESISRPDVFRICESLLSAKNIIFATACLRMRPGQLYQMNLPEHVEFEQSSAPAPAKDDELSIAEIKARNLRGMRRPHHQMSSAEQETLAKSMETIYTDPKYSNEPEQLRNAGADEREARRKRIEAETGLVDPVRRENESSIRGQEPKPQDRPNPDGDDSAGYLPI